MLGILCMLGILGPTLSWLKDWWRLEGVLALYCLSYSVSLCRGNIYSDL